MRGLGLIFLAGLAACAPTPMPTLAPGDVPVQFVGPVAEDPADWQGLEWWTAFGSDELTALIADVDARNLDLATNRRNLELAQIALVDAGFDLWPTPVLDAAISEGYSGARGPGTPYTDGGSSAADLSLGFSYTDIVSKPATYEAAKARYDASVALAADIRLNTLGTAASTYFSVLLIRDLLAAEQQNLENAMQIERIVNARVDAGTVAPLDALQQRIAVQRIRNNLASLAQDDLAARSALALLLADSVQRTEVSAATLENIEVPRVAADLPASLLTRRPDIAQAEANLRLSRANVDIVRTAFLPNVSISGSASLVGENVDDVVSAESLVVGAVASLAQTLIDNGQRGRNLARARIQLESALADYRLTAIRAFNEIDVALSNIAFLDQLGRFAVDDLARAEEAFRIAEVRYREGVDDFQTVLQAQNTLFGVRNNYYNNKLARLNAVVRFYQSLGGGWERGSQSAAR